MAANYWQPPAEDLGMTEAPSLPHRAPRGVAYRFLPEGVAAEVTRLLVGVNIGAATTTHIYPNTVMEAPNALVPHPLRIPRGRCVPQKQYPGPWYLCCISHNKSQPTNIRLGHRPRHLVIGVPPATHETNT